MNLGYTKFVGLHTPIAIYYNSIYSPILLHVTADHIFIMFLRLFACSHMEHINVAAVKIFTYKGIHYINLIHAVKSL